MTLNINSPSEVKFFWRSVGLVLTGTVAAQSIPLLGALVIARIYAPTEFGVFSAWMGIVMLAAVVVTGRFEMALAVEVDGMAEVEVVLVQEMEALVELVLLT
jgi:O-antigen/teichoic acid export membrane protein